MIELCEPIQVKQLDIANFELFSSTPKDFLVSISDRYIPSVACMCEQFLTGWQQNSNKSETNLFISGFWCICDKQKVLRYSLSQMHVQASQLCSKCTVCLQLIKCLLNGEEELHLLARFIE